MKRSLALCSLIAVATVVAPAQPRPRELEKPRLVVGIVIDQFRFDYLNRFHKEFTGGFARFFENGAVFANAHHEHFPTVTAIGHSTFMSGATPAISGIVNNEWYDRSTGKRVTSVSDDTVQMLGGARSQGASARRFLASTIGDELKIAGRDCKVIGISIKDRAAILPAGHAADGAYWFDGGTGNFVSSTFYFPDLPTWVKDFNSTRFPDKFAGAVWKSLDGSKTFKTLPAPGPALYNGLEASPYGNDLIEEFAEQAIRAEQLGKHPDTDLLTVSFSANDYVGHALGPDAPEVRDISLRTDLLLKKFMDYVDGQVGAGKVLYVITADHGVAPMPEINAQRRMPGGRLVQADLFRTIEAALSAKYGEGKWVVGNSGPNAYLNLDLIRQKNLDRAEVSKTAADAVRAMPNIFRVFTREQLMNGQAPQDRFTTRVRNGFYPARSGDIIPVPEAYWLYESRGTSHGTPFNYDTHVPVMFLGPNVVPGRYFGAVAVNDIAPTLAAILEIEIPSGAIGRVLTEMFPR